MLEVSIEAVGKSFYYFIYLFINGISPITCLVCLEFLVEKL